MRKARWEEGFGWASLVPVAGHLRALTQRGDLVLAEAAPEAYREKARARVLAGPRRAEIALANRRLYAKGHKNLVCWKLGRD